MSFVLLTPTPDSVRRPCALYFCHCRHAGESILIVSPLVIYLIFPFYFLQVFSGIRRTDEYYLNGDAHFESFPIAFITLFRCISGENWNGLMYEPHR